MKPRMIDPTFQVIASADDCYRTYDAASFYLTLSPFRCGYISAVTKDAGSAARFLALNIPAGSTINSAVLVLTCRTAKATVVINSRIRCEKTGTPAIFSDAINFDARTLTTNFVNWDAIPAWSVDTEYTSIDFKACVQEIIDNIGAITDLVVLWDDWEKRSTQVDGTYRAGQAFDGSNAKAPKLVITWTPPAVAGRSFGYIIG